MFKTYTIVILLLNFIYFTVANKSLNEYAPINGSCIGLRCGQYAGCFKNHVCTCEFGYSNDPKTDIYNCNPIKCKSMPSECVKRDKNSQCKNDKCVCNHEYELNKITQHCRSAPTSSSGKKLRLLLIVIGCILFGLVITLAFIGHRKGWFCRRSTVRRVYVR